MNKDTLIAIIINQDPKLAQAVSKMVDSVSYTHLTLPTKA